MNKYLLVLIMAAALAACESNVKPGADEESGAMGGPGGAQAGAVGAEGYGEGQALPVSYEAGAIHDANSVLAERVIYFDFDSSDVSDESVELIKHHGNYLSANPTASVRVEGHTDERGTREYNVALADRRAQSVERLLMFQGASSDQITIISYGEEKPARLGHDETAWSLNRRVELVY